MSAARPAKRPVSILLHCVEQMSTASFPCLCPGGVQRPSPTSGWDSTIKSGLLGQCCAWSRYLWSRHWDSVPQMSNAGGCCFGFNDYRACQPLQTCRGQPRALWLVRVLPCRGASRTWAAAAPVRLRLVFECRNVLVPGPAGRVARPPAVGPWPPSESPLRSSRQMTFKLTGRDRWTSESPSCGDGTSPEPVPAGPRLWPQRRGHGWFAPAGRSTVGTDSAQHPGGETGRGRTRSSNPGKRRPHAPGKGGAMESATSVARMQYRRKFPWPRLEDGSDGTWPACRRAGLLWIGRQPLVTALQRRQSCRRTITPNFSYHPPLSPPWNTLHPSPGSPRSWPRDRDQP